MPVRSCSSGRKALYWLILASFMVPTQTLIINHFVLIANMGLLNTWAASSCRSSFTRHHHRLKQFF